jgi:hypothetical protein
MADSDVLILQQGQQAIDNHIADATLQLEQGQRVTDTRVSQAHGDLANGQRAIVEDIHSAADNVIREVSTDTQFLQNGQRNIVGDVNRGFIGAARDAAATDRVVDAGVRHLDTGQRFIDQEVNRGFLGVERGLATSDRNTDNGFRWAMHEDREHERYEAGEFRGLERGQRQIDDRIADGFRSTDKSIAQSLYANDRSFGHVNEHLSDVERRLDNRLSDADRRTEVFVQKTYDTIKLEAERTRESGIKGELETRLYLRDREDRTEDLIRALADRNLDEMRGFERRSRDLAHHIDEENGERAYLNRALANQELKTELAIERALRHRHRDDDDDRIRFDPRINIILEEDEDRPRRRERRESSQTV